MLKLYTQAQSRLTTLGQKVRKVKDDESGATMIEYSILIGLITALVIAMVLFAGQWVEGAWTVLKTNLGAIPS